MKLKKIVMAFACAAAALGMHAQDLMDSEGRPYMYVAGKATDNWQMLDNYRMTRSGNTYSITLPALDGEFKVTSSKWTYNYGGETGDNLTTISAAGLFDGYKNGGNFVAQNLTDVTISFDMEFNEGSIPSSTTIKIEIEGQVINPVVNGISGTLPVLYINVYNEGSKDYNNEIIDRNLAHKNYFAGEYWLDTNGCAWLEELGAKSIGSAEEPLPLEIKARGNFTRTAFAKKPFKLKLGKKQSLLGMSKSKHYAILAHADDNCGYLRNFTGFYLGQQIGLPWTPSQQPVEVVINGDYRGLYFLTESIRIDEDRVNITELDDLATDPELISGGYLVELDNYDEDNQIRMYEKSCVQGHYLDMLRVTWDTPEEYSDIQKKFITDQFTAMNNFVGENSDELWKYLDLDDAVRYYLVEEIISHTESYHGSTYLFRDRGEGQKWHFSPLWDCGNAFNGSTDNFLYNCDPFGNTWIPSIRENETFNAKLRETWNWFMNNGYKGLIAEIDAYLAHIQEAAKADRRRWRNAQMPDSDNRQEVVDNSDLASRRARVVDHINSKVEWLKSQFGDFAANTNAAEPQRDNTPAAPLPAYCTPAAYTTVYFVDNNTVTPWESLYAYIYDSKEGVSGVYEPLGKWPGTAMTATVLDGKEAWTLTFVNDCSENARIIFNNGQGGTGNQTPGDFAITPGGVYSRDELVSGVENVEIAADGEAEYFNLQGMRVETPRTGEIYIVVKGDTAARIRF